MPVHAQVRNGQIELREPMPEDWEGQIVQITTLTPEEPILDLEERIQALHRLGPMEFEPGERRQIDVILADMNALSAAALRGMADTES